MIENQEASVTTNESSRTASSARSAIAVCCNNGAAMLQLADQDASRAIRAANEGQAKLLNAAADCADNLLSELRQCATEIEEAAKLLRPNYPSVATIYDRAAIRVMSAIRSSMA